MWLAALRHTEMAGELAAFWVVVSSATESVLGPSPSNTAHAEVVGEPTDEFQKVVGHCSKLRRPATRICDLLFVPPPGHAWLADLLNETTGQLREELAARRVVERELEPLQSSVVWVQDLVLGDVDGSSLLATSMSVVAEQLEGWIDAPTANGVCWGSHYALVVAVSHFPELYTDREVLGSGHKARLTKDEVVALWSKVRAVVDSLATHVPSLFAHNPPDSMGEYWW
jgi:hypothetical protein